MKYLNGGKAKKIGNVLIGFHLIFKSLKVFIE